MKFCETRNMMLLTTTTGVGAAYRCPARRRDRAGRPARSPREPVEADGRAAQAVRHGEPDGPTDAPPLSTVPLLRDRRRGGHVKYAPVSYLYACGSCDAF
jgi:hypothetical protein